MICAVSVFFFVRFVSFVVEILAFLLLEIHHQIKLPKVSAYGLQPTASRLRASLWWAEAHPTAPLSHP